MKGRKSDSDVQEGRIPAASAIILWRPRDEDDSGDVLIGTRDQLAASGALFDNTTWPCSGGAVYRDWLRPKGALSASGGFVTGKVARASTTAATFRRITRCDKVPREVAAREFAKIVG
jgi:hypothetical protein